MSRTLIKLSWLLGTLLIGTVPALPAASQTIPGATSIGVEAGLPLVFGFDVSQRVNPNVRVSVGLGRIGGLTAVRAEGRWLLRDELSERFVPSLLAGAEQYLLKDGDLDATPAGVHAGFGIDYHFASPVALGMRFGGLATFGSSEGGDLKVFSVQNGFRSGFFNVGVRYHF